MTTPVERATTALENCGIDNARTVARIVFLSIEEDELAEVIADKLYAGGGEYHVAQAIIDWLEQ